MIYPGKFGGIPSVGSRDIMGTRICPLNPPMTLKMRSGSSKHNQLVPMIYPGKIGEIPSTGARNIMGTRVCHADADTSGIRTETNMFPSPLVGS